MSDYAFSLPGAVAAQAWCTARTAAAAASAAAVATPVTGSGRYARARRYRLARQARHQRDPYAGWPAAFAERAGRRYGG